MSPLPRRNLHGLCTPECGYRPMYEGSQASLADMASKQEGALTRVSRLRRGLIDSMKQTFPVEFGDAERSLGRRMSAADDEVLLAYLTGFLVMPKAQTATRSTLSGGVGTRELRAALAGLGITLPAEDDPAMWAASVQRWAETRTPPQVRVVPAEEAGKAPDVHVSDARLTPGHISDLPPLPPEGPAPGFSAPPAPPAMAPPPEAPPEEALPEDGDGGWLDSVFSSAPTALPPLPEEIAPAADEDDTFDVADLFAPLPSPPAPLPFAVPEVDSAAPAMPPAAAPAEETAAPRPAEHAKPAVVSVRDSGPIKPEPAAAPAAVRKTTKRKPTKRTSRVSASSPSSDPRAELTAAAADGALTDAVREKLLATVCMPRPVFVADLVHLVGDAALVEEWERECKQMGTESPIRFIAAKPRHRARGHLVIPFSPELRERSADLPQSYWAQCITQLLGARLYELAVLLHRVLDQVITFELGADVVTLRVNQPRGIVGVVVALTPDVSSGTPAREELRTALAGLATSRLSLLAVCSYAGGPRTIPDLAEAVRADLDTLPNGVGFPVIAQSSWEFAADGGTSAIAVTG